MHNSNTIERLDRVRSVRGLLASQVHPSLVCLYSCTVLLLAPHAIGTLSHVITDEADEEQSAWRYIPSSNMLISITAGRCRFGDG